MIQRLETDAIRDKKDNRPLLHQKRRHRLTGRYPQKNSGRREESPSGTTGKIPCRNVSRGKWTYPSCNFGHHPVCLTHKSESGCTYVDKYPNTLRLMGEEKWCKRISCLIRGVFHLGCVSQDSHPRKSIPRKERKIGTKWHRQIIQGHVAPQIWGTNPSRGVIQTSCAPPIWGEDTRWNLAPRKMRPQRCKGLDEKCLQAQKKYRWRYVLLSHWSQGNAGAHFKISGGTRIRGWLRSIKCTCWAKKVFEFRRNGDTAVIQESQNSGNGRWRCANKRGSPRCSRSWSLRDGANTRWHASSSITWKTLRRTRMYLWVGQRSKAARSQTRQENFMQHGKFRTSCCPWIVVQFWYQFVLHIATGLVTCIFNSSTRAKWRTRTRKLARCTQKPKTKTKRGITIMPRRTVCKTFRNGLGSSQKISKIQKCLLPHTFLMTQIRNVLQKWPPGSTVFMLTSQKTELAKSVCEPRWQGLLAEDALAKAVPRAEDFGDLITADHKVLNEEGESRNNHQYGVVVQDLALNGFNLIRERPKLLRRRRRV